MNSIQMNGARFDGSENRGEQPAVKEEVRLTREVHRLHHPGVRSSQIRSRASSAGKLHLLTLTCPDEMKRMLLRRDDNRICIVCCELNCSAKYRHRQVISAMESVTRNELRALILRGNNNQDASEV